MQTQEKPPESPLAVEQKVAQLLEEFAVKVGQRSGVKAGENVRMRRDERVVWAVLRPSAIGHISDIVIQQKRVFVLLLDGRTGKGRKLEFELRWGICMWGIASDRIFPTRST